MADPLFTPAVVGYAVNMFFTEVIAAVRSALNYKKRCKTVGESVKKLQPAIDDASQSSANWPKAESDWLEEIKGLLKKAGRVAEKGVHESKAQGRKRAVMCWRWRRLQTALEEIVQDIENAKQNIIFVNALGDLTQRNNPKEKGLLPFVQQQVPAGIVGVDAPFSKLKASILANHVKDKSSHLGLYGRGGAGKTLLAQMLHNDKDIQEKYGASSILWITVGHDARVPDLYKKMGSFLGDGSFEKTGCNQNLDDQRTYLCDAFAQKKVFLVLDDIWEEKCAQNHEMMHWLNIATGPGSITLITTRSISLLARIYAKSEVVMELSFEDSWELFRSRAFHDGVLSSTISEELAKDVCKECKGLPLALKVIGSAMVDKASEGEWQSALRHLQQSRPILGSTVDVELFDRLRLSYDMLKDNVLKTCFLYLAAFPEDYEINVSKLFGIWIAEGLFGSLDVDDAKSEAQTHLEILEKRSLVDWNRKFGYVKVHDILRDAALYIIDKANLGDSAYACFFHSGKVLKSFPRSKSLQAIKRMSFMNSSIQYWPEEVEASNLEVCLLSNIDIPSQCIFECFISNMTSLKYLDLSQVKFNSEAPSIDFKRINSLMYLDLSKCEFLKDLLESIGELKCLMHLELCWCKSLMELPKSIGELKCLTQLDLHECESLIELPKSIGELKCLTHLDLYGCKSLKELPKSIGKLKCLTQLDLRGCESLIELPKSIEELKCLTHLELHWCKSLKELPKSIGELKCLTQLDLYGCEFLKELPESIGELKCLTHLELHWCKSLKELPKSIGELKCLTQLDLYGCEFLKELPESIGDLKCLTHLELHWCKSLMELPKSIGELKCLTHLELRGCESLIELPESIGELKCLTQLDLHECESLIELPKSIRELKCLTHLELCRCKSLKELPKSIGELKCLTQLDLFGCESLMELPKSIGELKCFTHLELRGCEFLEKPSREN